MTQKQIDWTKMPPDISEGFQKFHKQNPHVFIRLREMALTMKRHGRSRLGIKMLFEVLRWERMLETSGDEFKLNNNYSAFYARMLEETTPELKGIFATRKSISDE